MQKSTLPPGLRFISFLCALFGGISTRRLPDWVATLQEGPDSLPAAAFATVLTALNGPLLILVAVGIAFRRPLLGRVLGNVWAASATLGLLVSFFIPAFGPWPRLLPRFVFPLAFLWLINTRYRGQFSSAHPFITPEAQAAQPVPPSAPAA